MVLQSGNLQGDICFGRFFFRFLGDFVWTLLFFFRSFGNSSKLPSHTVIPVKSMLYHILLSRLYGYSICCTHVLF